jgi:acetyl-CoA C-acetyltransferase
MDPRTPVIVGAGQLSHRHEPGGELRDPVSLAAEALRIAGEDSGTGDALLRRADSVRCVPSTSWQYRDQAALTGAAVGATPRETVQTTVFGGDGPQRLIGETAAAIAAGDVDVALLSGAESVATLLAEQREGRRPRWPEQPEGVAPTRTIGTDRQPVTDAEAAVGLLAPVNVYALIETALRAREGRGADEHLRRIAGLWARFSEVAAQNPHAWLREARSAEQIATPTAGNRIVSTPYLKLMTANIQVDQAAALIVCSAEAAQRAGVPRDRWVFPWASGYADEEWFVSERADMAASPALGAAAKSALAHAEIAVDDVAHVDLYSCFPVAVEVGAAELGIDLEGPARAPTLTGGLTFAGGPGNDYALHATATLVGRLRDDPSAFGLSTALGWYLTKHAASVFSATPPSRPFELIDAADTLDRPAPRDVAAGYEGTATVEAYTVPHGRDGTPEAAIVTAITPAGDRALARTENAETIGVLLDSDPLGSPVEIAGSDVLGV